MQVQGLKKSEHLKDTPSLAKEHVSSAKIKEQVQGNSSDPS